MNNKRFKVADLDFAAVLAEWAKLEVKSRNAQEDDSKIFDVSAILTE